MNGPSRTAEYMALFRAIEFSRGSPAVCRDPLARYFVQRCSLRSLVQISRIPPARALITWVIDRRWPGARTSGVARTRLIDELLIEALGSGFKQVVILGAGFDSRAHRIEGINRAVVIEADHPATLAEKRARLARAISELPPNLIFTEIDFNRQRLEDALDTAGFDRSARTFFIWEGVTNYLTEEAVDSTLRFVAASCAGGRLVFTYVDKKILDELHGPLKDSNLARLLQRSGEPWTFGIDPDRIADFVGERGLRLVEDIGSIDYRKRYMKPNCRNLVGYEFYRVVVADVAVTGGRKPNA